MKDTLEPCFEEVKRVKDGDDVLGCERGDPALERVESFTPTCVKIPHSINYNK